MANSQKITYTRGSTFFPKVPHGPVSAGLPCSGTVFTPAGAADEAAVFTRIWDEAYMFPDFDMRNPPVKITEGLGGCRGVTAVDWNRDGTEDFVISNRDGFLFLYEQTVKGGRISLEDRGIIRDYKTGHVFNLPFDHPAFGHVDDLDGYVSVGFFNYLYPAHYPGRAGRADLIIGDSAGKLWWLPDESEGEDPPKYTGKAYQKEEKLLINASGRACVAQYGETFAAPREQILNEAGEPFVIGDFFEYGTQYDGGCTKPMVLCNEETGLYDLLVAGGCMKIEMRWLKCVKIENGKPVFRDMGKVTPDFVKLAMYFHLSFAFSLKKKKLAITGDPSSGVFEYDFVWENGRPAFQNARRVMADDTGATGYLVEYILRDEATGKAYLNDFPHKLCLREIMRELGNVRIAYKAIELNSGGKIVEPKGGTDPQMLESWGFHRSAVWNWDQSGKNHIVVGTDTGNLLLVSDTGSYFTTGECKLSPYLKDSEGSVIKIHNRAKAVAFDLDGDGREDLIIGGQSYQLGVQSDPCPGSDFVAYLNRGAGEDRLPVLEKIPLVLNGHEFAGGTNRHMHLFTADIDRDGETEVILSVQQEGFVGRIFKKVPGKAELVYTGSDIEGFGIDDSLIDIDGDGELELVFGGGETGFILYHKLVKTEKA